MSGDAYHISAPCETATAPSASCSRTLKDAGVEPSAVDYVNVHGTSTPQGDKVEVLAIKGVFGDHARKLAISSTKSMTGHLLGAAGGLEAGITALALRDQVLAPTINYENPDPECDLDFVPNAGAQGRRSTYALSNSFGFGGTNGALLFKRWAELRPDEDRRLREAGPRHRDPDPDRARRQGHRRGATSTGSCRPTTSSRSRRR